MMNKQSQLHSPVMIWLSLVVRMTLFAVALMWPAGTWYWREAWGNGRSLDHLWGSDDLLFTTP